MGQYLVGFDTIGYYVPNTIDWLGHGVNFWYLLSSAPFTYLLIMGITSIGASITILLKIMGPVILGLLGLAVYFYAVKALSWAPKKSLLVAVISTLYFVALRVSWDMFRAELAVIFLFIALIFLQKNRFDVKSGFLLLVSMVLVVLTHQLIAVVLFGILAAVIIDLLYKKQTQQLPKLVALVLPSAVMFGIIFLVSYVFSNQLMGFSTSYMSGFEALTNASYSGLVEDTLGFLLFCYLPLVPLLIFSGRSFRNKLHLNAWIGLILLILLIVILSPNTYFIAGVLPYRWTMLLVYPLAFYAVEGLSRIKWNWYKVAVSFLLAVLSLTFLALPNSDSFGYYSYYPAYVPKSMLQNTVQLSDCEDTANALLWAQNSLAPNGSLLVHQAFYGWAKLSLDDNSLMPYFFSTPEGAVGNLTKTGDANSLYLIWWVNGTGWYGQPTVPQSFEELYRSGNIAIYHYTST